jgi:hypothetical protein
MARRASLNTRRSVLVVARDEGLRRSIAFALEVEGLLVVSSASLTTLPKEFQLAPFGCIVIDEDAVVSDKRGSDRMMEIAAPIVLLVDSMKTIPTSFCGAVLRKPLLGERLVKAVAGALGSTVPSK